MFKRGLKGELMSIDSSCLTVEERLMFGLRLLLMKLFVGGEQG